VVEPGPLHFDTVVYIIIVSDLFLHAYRSDHNVLRRVGNGLVLVFNAPKDIMIR
jgi:hypothetical protein